MAHQTGIEPSQKLKKLMSEALEGSIRFFQVIIENEQLVPGEKSVPKGTWGNDLDKLLQPVLKEKEPCYVFYRLDSRNVQNNYQWIFMCYIPDFAPVRGKMLYSATKATLKKAFDCSTIVDDMAVTCKEELSLAGYKKFQLAKEAAPPLTLAEQELKEMHEKEDVADVGTSTRQSHLHGVAFPIHAKAMASIRRFKNKQLSYVQLSIDVKKEMINLEVEEGGSLSVSDLPPLIPSNSPRYHLYLYNHTYEGDYQEAIVFLYSCPGFNTTIKERMLYSSCKEPLVSAIEQELECAIDRKVAVASGSEIDDAFLMDEVHPKKTIVRPKFLKPKGPNRRPKSPNTNRDASCSPVNRDASCSPVNRDASCSPVNRDARCSAVNRDASCSPVNREANSSPVNRGASSSPVDGKSSF